MDSSSAKSQIEQLLEATQRTLSDAKVIGQLDEAAGLIVAAIKAGNKVLTCGNGGSATDANHLAEELVGRYKGDRPSLPAISLASDGGVLTCIGNDYGFDEIFSRQVTSLGQSGDVLVAFSTSGNSENVNRALQTAKARNVKTVALLGKTGGSAKELADVAIVFPSDTTARIQELHTMALHIFCEALENQFSN